MPKKKKKKKEEEEWNRKQFTVCYLECLEVYKTNSGK